MILTLFSMCLKYLQLERSMYASHNHLCLCGPRETVPFGLCAGLTFWQGSDRAPTRAAGAARAFLGFAGFLSISFLLSLLVKATPVHNFIKVL